MKRSTSMKTLTCGFALLATLHVRNASACPVTPLPSLDCTVSSVCCTASSADPTAVWPANLRTTRNDDFCDHALIWKSISSFCTGDALSRHNTLFNIETDTYSGFGLNQCDPTQDYGKHWLSAYLVANSIDYVPGVSWHHPIRDYLAAAASPSNDFHDESEHIHGEDDNSNANFFDDPFDEDEITFECPLFRTGWPGTAIYRASDFVHEAWHDTYGGHDKNNAQDNYHAHNHVLGPGQMDQDVSSDDSDLITSVYQAQYEFQCDIDTTPAAWLPRELAWEAGVISGLMLTKYGQTGTQNDSVFLQSPPILCDVRPPARRNPDVPEVANGRRLRLHVEGNLHFEDAVDTDDDFASGDFEFTLANVGDHGAWHWESQSVDDEMHAVLDVSADLTDPETIQVTWVATFFEDGDLENTQTSAATVVLDSQNFDAPPQPINLSCCDTDRADLRLDLHLDW